MDVKTADFAIAKSPEILTTSGIGSCIVICLYDKNQGIGALGHMMLPRGHSSDTNKLRYVNSAIPHILNELKKVAPFLHLQASLFGGANMFPELWSGEESVGTSNIAMARQTLHQLNIEIIKEDIGGTRGRSLEFSLEDGTVKLTGDHLL